MMFLFYRPPSPTLDEKLQRGRSVTNSPVAQPKRGRIRLFLARLHRLSRSAVYTLFKLME